jgi:prepilin-type N-terminal cleavage/methylation domain-containing protein
MKNKAFTLVELIIVIAILAIIMLIGTVAYSGIQERMKIRADRATAGEIGKALTVREVDIGKEKGIELYPKLTVYDQLDEIETYIAKGIKPQSMKDGKFIATALQTATGKKIIVGIGKEGQEMKDEPYSNSKEAGWAWTHRSST